MDKTILQDVADPKERVRQLKDNADEVEKLGYSKPLPAEKINELKERLTENSIKTEDVSCAKSVAVHSYNEELKELGKERSEILRQLRDKAEFVNEICYKFIDHEAGKVGYYNEDGVLVYERGILPSEREKTIFEAMPMRVQKTGTNDR